MKTAATRNLKAYGVFAVASAFLLITLTATQCQAFPFQLTATNECSSNVDIQIWGSRWFSPTSCNLQNIKLHESVNCSDIWFIPQGVEGTYLSPEDNKLMRWSSTAANKPIGFESKLVIHTDQYNGRQIFKDCSLKFE